MKPFIKSIGDVSYNYSLKSVIEHRGNSYGGHYVAMKRLEWDNMRDVSPTWVLADDDTIEFCDDRDSLR